MAREYVSPIELSTNRVAGKRNAITRAQAEGDWVEEVIATAQLLTELEWYAQNCEPDERVRTFGQQVETKERLELIKTKIKETFPTDLEEVRDIAGWLTPEEVIKLQEE